MRTKTELYRREASAGIPAMGAWSLLRGRLANPTANPFFNNHFMKNVGLSLEEQGGKHRIIIQGKGVVFTFTLEPDAVVYSVRGKQEVRRVFRKLSNAQGKEEKGEPIWINVGGFCEEGGRRFHVQMIWNKKKGFREDVDETNRQSVFRR